MREKERELLLVAKGGTVVAMDRVITIKEEGEEEFVMVYASLQVNEVGIHGNKYGGSRRWILFLASRSI